MIDGEIKKPTGQYVNSRERARFGLRTGPSPTPKAATKPMSAIAASAGVPSSGGAASAAAEEDAKSGPAAGGPPPTPPPNPLVAD